MALQKPVGEFQNGDLLRIEAVKNVRKPEDVCLILLQGN